MEFRAVENTSTFFAFPSTIRTSVYIRWVAGVGQTRGGCALMFYIIEALPCLHTHEPGEIVIQGLVPPFFKNEICAFVFCADLRTYVARVVFVLDEFSRGLKILIKQVLIMSLF